MFEFIKNTIETIWVFFWAAVFGMFNAVCCFFIDMATGFITDLDIDFTPYEDVLVIGDEILYVANVYLPLPLIGTLLGFYAAWMISVWTVRMVIKLIPTIG